MLEVTSTQMEHILGVDFAEHYGQSKLFQQTKEMVETLSKPTGESKELTFATKYAQPFCAQYIACLWKQNLSYWRNPQYTAVRFFYTVIISLMFGTICWKFGSKRETQHDIFNAMGAMYAAVLFIGITNATSVQPVISIERFVSYRERERESSWDVFSSLLHFLWLLWSSRTFLCSHLSTVQSSTVWVRLSGQQPSSCGTCSSCTSHCCTSPSTA
uniref:GSVIVT01015456001 n=1 Tax=Arundo donax TaxID=35708 RepID=A0A0A9A0P8_ARUDO